MINVSSYLLVLVLLLVLSLSMMIRSAAAVVVILRNDFAVSLQSREATFAKPVGKYGISAYLHLGIPVDACSSMIPARQQQLPSPTTPISSPFALISGGDQCSVRRKAQNAQKAGFAGAILFDDAHSSQLITTVGDGPTEEVDIYVMFVSNSAGVILQQYARGSMPEIWLLPDMDSDSICPVISISIISFLAIASMSLAYCLIRRNVFSAEAYADGLFKMRIEDVRALPIVLFTGLPNGRMSDGTCAICLEDYLHRERLRVLPCFHRFHSSCIDAWLEMWKPICPLCRRDPRPNSLSSSETTPLLAPPQPNLQQLQPFDYGTTDIESSPHSLPMQIPNAINSQFQSLMVPSNPQTLANNASPVFSTLHVSEHTSFHSQADDSLEAFRTSPHFISPRYLNT